MNIVSSVLLLAQQGPDPEDVKAGWVAFGVFLLLAVAVVVLAFSLVKHLKRARRNFDDIEQEEREHRTPPAP